MRSKPVPVRHRIGSQLGSRHCTGSRWRHHRNKHTESRKYFHCYLAEISTLSNTAVNASSPRHQPVNTVQLKRQESLYPPRLTVGCFVSSSHRPSTTGAESWPLCCGALIRVARTFVYATLFIGNLPVIFPLTAEFKFDPVAEATKAKNPIFELGGRTWNKESVSKPVSSPRCWQ